MKGLITSAEENKQVERRGHMQSRLERARTLYLRTSYAWVIWINKIMNFENSLSHPRLFTKSGQIV